MEFATTKIECHGCGATVEFKATNSLVAVCPYCQTTVAKSKEDIDNYGLKANIFNDFSKIKIGAVGSYKGEQFSVIGRVQIKYIHGFWNEWYILFSNGMTGWLSDVMEEYYVTFEYNQKNAEFIESKYSLKYSEADSFGDFKYVQVDKVYRIGVHSFLAVDVSEAKIIGAEGEIGFNIIQNRIMKVVDLRKDNLFVTADFSENERDPIYYIGEAVKEDDLSLFNVKTLEEINEATGAYKGKLTSFSCPSCGNGNPKVNGSTNKVFCVSCASELDVSEKTAKVLSDAQNNREQHETTLHCGQTGVIKGSRYIVIGVILKKEVGENSEWVEYLLYKKGGNNLFLWLIEDRSNGSWTISESLTGFPKYGVNSLLTNNSEYKKLYDEDYYGKVLAVWGSLSWEVNINDVVKITDYSNKKNKDEVISKEIMETNQADMLHREISFTLNKKITTQEVLTGFKVHAANVVAATKNEDDAEVDYNTKNFYVKLFFAQLLLAFSIGGFNGYMEDVFDSLMLIGAITYFAFKIEDSIVGNGDSDDDGGD